MSTRLWCCLWLGAPDLPCTQASLPQVCTPVLMLQEPIHSSRRLSLSMMGSRPSSSCADPRGLCLGLPVHRSIWRIPSTPPFLGLRPPPHAPASAAAAASCVTPWVPMSLNWDPLGWGQTSCARSGSNSEDDVILREIRSSSKTLSCVSEI